MLAVTLAAVVVTRLTALCVRLGGKVVRRVVLGGSETGEGQDGEERELVEHGESFMT